MERESKDPVGVFVLFFQLMMAHVHMTQAVQTHARLVDDWMFL